MEPNYPLGGGAEGNDEAISRFYKFSKVRQSGGALGMSIYVHVGLKKDGLWNLRMTSQ